VFLYNWKFHFHILKRPRLDTITNWIRWSHNCFSKIYAYFILPYITRLRKIVSLPWNFETTLLDTHISFFGLRTRSLTFLQLVRIEYKVNGTEFLNISIFMFLRCHIIIIIIIFNLRTAAFKAYCAIWVRSSNFRYQASPRVSPRESTQRRKVELWARNVREFCLNAGFQFTFRDLLHAVKLRHGTDGFTSPQKEGVLRIFSP